MQEESLILARVLVGLETARKLDLKTSPSTIPGCVYVDSALAKIAGAKCSSNVDSRFSNPKVEKKSNYSKGVHKTWDKTHAAPEEEVE